MARVKKAMNARKKHKKVLKLAKGYRGSRSKLYRPANEFVMKALKHAYVGRKLKKRDFRKLWIQRINAGTRANGMSYSRFMNGLKLAGVEVNRKMLSEMAINDPQGFAKLVEVAKSKLA
ncbi:MAG: 50S ribosomal protein L20 [Paraclostridium bifermentans]|uniref:Large ribosomal subunit protein bL20 n=2 Tax=Paraclostridium bifermentans TaxID=1490 RepID=T4VLY6_PARBF|nr:50S ribosomal protein L20 [Paraclostridium bifermentans]EQK44724.1 ribosomal protein L20 [[Clostridium] bifermentans ATCC 638] [Paraclostridium bifermentans ATCC 638 = DSM 14991]MBS6508216.1 50S ribosomal protein L20 [Paraclostridium bifermentans]MDU3802760.1 50S ribosomal protein L20 [Paraclostridium bifermentans]RIZ58254.1 50S ribosomal protein L20 [Paraclostridium bifermentans]UAG17877.1 50S ribosomal protein L20 [Paraclostridium bifermentans]